MDWIEKKSFTRHGKNRLIAIPGETEQSNADCRSISLRDAHTMPITIILQ